MSLARGAGTYPPLELFVAGEWLSGQGRETLPVIDPATGKVLGEAPCASPADLDRAVQAAMDAAPAWRRASAFDRAAILHGAAACLRRDRETLARAMTLEQGKPIAQARAEIASSADVFDWYAEEGRRAYGRIIPGRDPNAILSVWREPVGLVLGLSPWNFPMSQAARKVAPALAAGCCCILKPSEETPASGLALARVLAEAGLPRGVLSVVVGPPAEISSRLLAAPQVRKVSFTGSTAVGKLIARQAAEGVKRVTLELGGHAPVIVCKDADPAAAARAAVTAKFRNAGQVCIAPTRFYVEEDIYHPFVAHFVETAQALRIGHGLDETVELGPLANPRRLEAMASFTADAVAQGGRLLCGGQRRGNEGGFWEPTVLVDTPDSARAMNEEPFGPMALIRPFGDLAEALASANRLPYGLAAYAFTRDPDRRRRLQAELESGLVGLNTFAVAWAETPFGGVKESGYGSEGGPEGLEPYLATKFVSEA